MRPVRQRPPGRSARPTCSGLGAGTPGGPSDTLLKQIASDTGGLYRRADDAGAMQAAMFDLNSAIACQTPPKRFSDAFTKVGQGRRPTLVTIPSRINTAQFALTWANSADTFTIGRFRVIRHGKVVARSAKVRKLKVSRRRGSTFTTVRVSGLVPGKLRFSVRASQALGAGHAGEPDDAGDAPRTALSQVARAANLRTRFSPRDSK